MASSKFGTHSARMKSSSMRNLSLTHSRKTIVSLLSQPHCGPMLDHSQQIKPAIAPVRLPAGASGYAQHSVLCLKHHAVDLPVPELSLMPSMPSIMMLAAWNTKPNINPPPPHHTYHTRTSTAPLNSLPCPQPALCENLSTSRRNRRPCTCLIARAWSRPVELCNICATAPR